MKNIIERTLIIIKPDAVQRAIVGAITEYFENTGLKLLTAKMVRPGAETIKKHYPGTTDWITEMGTKTLESFKKSNLNVKEKLGTDKPYELGKFIYDRLIKYWMEGPIIVTVWEGPSAVSTARKIRGHTIPAMAEVGTIHAYYSYDSSVLSSTLDRVVKTFVHASGSKEEAEREIKYWFGTTKFKSYERDVDKLYLR